MKSGLLFVFAAALAMPGLAADKINKNAAKIRMNESIKLVPVFTKNDPEKYSVSTSKYETDSLGVVRLADTSNADVEIVSLVKVNEGYLLNWEFTNYYIDTALLTIAEKPAVSSFLKAIEGFSCEIKLNPKGNFEEFVNEDELYERMDANNEAEEAVKDRLISEGKTEKSDDMADMMLDLLRYKVVEKKFNPLFVSFTALYGKTYIQDSLVSAEDLEKQGLEEAEEEETDALSKMLAASFENSMQRIGGAVMRVDTNRTNLAITYDVSIDMSEMMSSMAGLFSGVVSELAGGFAEAFGADSTGGTPGKENIQEAKDKIKEEMETAMKDMKMIARNIMRADFDYTNHQPRYIKDQKIVEGVAEGKDQYECQTTIFIRKE